MINPLGNTARAREGAHAHARRLPCTCSYAEAGDAAAEIVANCFPHCAKDFALWAWYCRHFDRERIVRSAVERVRRHFGRRDKAKGNKYARVAYAYFKRRGWRKTGLPRRTFFHALKKVKVFYMPANKGRNRRLHGAGGESR